MAVRTVRQDERGLYILSSNAVWRPQPNTKQYVKPGDRVWVSDRPSTSIRVTGRSFGWNCSAWWQYDRSVEEVA